MGLGNDLVVPEIQVLRFLCFSRAIAPVLVTPAQPQAVQCVRSSLLRATSEVSDTSEAAPPKRTRQPRTILNIPSLHAT